jgi:hypothetical protein
MFSFLKFLAESNGGTLYVFDIDDTMFHTTAKIGVMDKSGKIIKRLSSADFTDYKLKPDEKYDYSEFRNADKFHRESKPINKMLSKVRRIHAGVKRTANSRVIINTARTDLDDKEKFLSTFRKNDIDIDDIHVHRAGNLPGEGSTAEKKVKIIKDYIMKHGYKKVVMYDDSTSNLTALLKMNREYPNIKFIAYHAQPDGSIKQYNGETK